MATPKRILVTGATGKQGGAVARTLLARGHAVRALCRHPGSSSAAALARMGVEIATGEIQSPELDAAMAGMDAAFALCTPFEGVIEEVRNGFALVDAARRTGLPHLVYASAANADRGTGIPTFESKRHIEERLRRSGVPFTIVAPVYFMENLLEDFSLGQLRAGRYVRWFPLERPLQLIAVEDIGRFAVHAFEHRDDFLGARVDLAGDALDGREMAEVLSRVLGRHIEPVSLPLERFPRETELGASLAVMMHWLDTTGFDVDIPALRRHSPEIGWHTFEAWALRQDWRGAQTPAEPLAHL